MYRKSVAYLLLATFTSSLTLPTAFGNDLPSEIETARTEGQADGAADGAREADARGNAEGMAAGRDAGYKDAFARCERQEQKRARDNGFADGFLRGEAEGVELGRAEGTAEGDRKGFEEGRADGMRRADTDAKREAPPKGSAAGIQEANGSDTAERAARDGVVAGDRDALKKAEAEDYPFGRRQYRDERFAEAIEHTDLLENLLSSTQKQGVSSRSFVRVSGVSAPAPDNRFFNPRRQYPSQQENLAYSEAYALAYNAEFRSSYEAIFQPVFDQARRTGEEAGCEAARQADYRSFYQTGWNDGKPKGYAKSYRAERDKSARAAYQSRFQEASNTAYQQTYNTAYERYFEQARSEAFAKRVGEIYQAAFIDAHDRRFAETYPGHAQSEKERGRKEEHEDFVLRPVRLIEGSVVESVADGVYEPGEALAVSLVLRNFADHELKGEDIKIQVESLSPTLLTLPSGETTLSRDLQRKSIVKVKRGFQFYLNESALGRTAALRLTAFYKGRVIGEVSLQPRGQYSMEIQIVETPVLKEGLEAALRVKVKNRSQLPSEDGMRVSFRTKSRQVEVKNSDVALPSFRPGEERMVEFPMIARTEGRVNLAYAVEATVGSGRRVGILDQTGSLPVRNDYTIEPITNLTELKSAGIVRLGYLVTNVASRAITKTLELSIRIESKSAEDVFAITGPNPQFLRPLVYGQQSRFVAPVVVKSSNSGGAVFLELREAGRTVIIRKFEF
ncbi:MAG: hypothetical protein A2X94_01530 [Bdellovibrionales bacterium GWB1_55_8]|nr:MAG: hypothetical protein A2X94_01530 [Bdellovibrionales bacterium GWB1_55_8]